MKNFLRDKNKYIFSIIVMSMLLIMGLTSSLYIGDFLELKVQIVSLILILLVVIGMSYIYGALGFISSMSISLMFTLSIVFFKFLEFNFSWSGYTAIFLGISLAINNSLILLERTRVNLQNDWSLKKSYETSKSNTFNTNLDKDIIVFIMASIIFLINTGEVSSIGSTIILTSSLSFVLITIMNPILLSMFIKFKIKDIYLFGLSKTFKASKSNFLKNTKKIKYAFIGTIVLGAMLLIIYTSLDAASVKDLFQSSVASDLNKKSIINFILTLLAIIGVFFIYITIRYRWNFALALLISVVGDILLVGSLFIIARLDINPLFIASLLIVILYSVSFSLNSFKDLKDRVESHVGELTTEIMHSFINNQMSKNTTRILFTFGVGLVSFLTIFNIGNQDMFTLGSLIALLVAIISSKTITSVVWVKLELFRLKKTEERTKNNFWKTSQKEEQTVNGINNYKS